MSAPRDQAVALQGATGWIFAGHAFRLDVTDQATGQPVPSFQQPVALTVRYMDSDWQVAGVVERSLRIHSWNGGRWMVEWPCGGCILRWDLNRIDVQVDHAGDFALFGRDVWPERFLPLILR